MSFPHLKPPSNTEIPIDAINPIPAATTGRPTVPTNSAPTPAPRVTAPIPVWAVWFALSVSLAPPFPFHASSRDVMPLMLSFTPLISSASRWF